MIKLYINKNRQKYSPIILVLDFMETNIHSNKSMPNLVRQRNRDYPANTGRDISDYYCNKESIREQQYKRSSYIDQMEMDEIMTYAYSSDENDYMNQTRNMKDSEDDSLGNVDNIFNSCILSIFSKYMMILLSTYEQGK